MLLSFFTRTATTTPSSQGMSGLTRTSRLSWQARVTDAILSSSTVFMTSPPAPAAPAIRAHSSPGKATIREKPRASAAVHSPVASP